MSDDVPGDREPAAAASAGALLRQARQAQGLSLDALASAMKVAPHKLELLESDRYADLHDPAYMRALAQGVCRSLRIEPAPVLAMLPQAVEVRLDQINKGLNAPFRDRPTGALTRDWSLLARPVVWGPVVIGAAAAALYFFPSDLTGPAKVQTRVVPPAIQGAASAAAPTATVVETVFSAPVQAAGPGGSAPVSGTVSGLLQLRATAQSWVEVFDARGQMLLSRVIQPGETVGLDGPPPFKVKIGNSAGTQLVFRGEPVELGLHTRENVAKLELK